MMKKKLTKKPKRHVVVVLPTYNEADNIEKVITEIFSVTKKETPYDFSILVVDDNSPDKTASAVKTMQKNYSQLYLLTGKKEGLGAAYVRGMNYAIEQLQAEILFEMDSDLSHDPKLIPQFLLGEISEFYPKEFFDFSF